MMKLSASERHNALARDFVHRVGRETESASEVMVVLESTIMAGMLLLQTLHGVTPRNAAELVDSAVHAATERFVGGAK